MLVINKKLTVVLLAIYNPNGAIMYCTYTAEMNMPHLPRAARVCHIVLGLRTYSLISIGQLCNAGCAILILTNTISIGFQNTVIMQGVRALATGLWHLNLCCPRPLHGTPPITMLFLLPNNGCEHKVASLNLRPSMPAAAPTAPQLQTCLTAVGSVTPQALVASSHAALFSPSLSTLVTALTKVFLPPMTGLALATLRKYPPKSVATIKGHLDQICKNLRSTKTIKSPTVPGPPDGPDALTGFFPSSDNGNPTTHYCYAAVISLQPTGQVHTDQNGKFPVTSSTGNNYLLIVYDYDSNGILAKPMPRRTGLCILHAYKTIHTRLTTAGLHPKLQRLDNEASLILEDFMTKEGIDYQLVPPGVHR
jgi:hypothetical protein